MIEETRDGNGDPRPALTTLFIAFLRLGATAFGGPAMIAYIRKMAVGQRKWLGQEVFQDGVTLCQTIPGATAIQMAAYVGLRTRGVRGALCSYIGFGLPAFLLMLGLSVAYARAHALPGVVSIFSGLQAIIVAILTNAALSFGKNALKSWKSLLIALVAAVLFWLMANPLLIILLSAALGLLLKDTRPSTGGAPAEPMRHTFLPLVWLGAAASVGFALLFLFRRDLFQLAALISRIDLMAFGGGFASIPLMFHEIVEVRSWMDASTFMNGIVLGQFTPGPIVITATFVGYVVGGPLGALVATVAVFLPSFLILVGVAPWFDRVRTLPWVAPALSGILSSFVGLLFTAALRMALQIHWDWPHAALAASALTALLLNLDILWVVLAGAALSAVLF